MLHAICSSLYPSCHPPPPKSPFAANVTIFNQKEYENKFNPYEKRGFDISYALYVQFTYFGAFATAAAAIKPPLVAATVAP